MKFEDLPTVIIARSNKHLDINADVADMHAAGTFDADAWAAAIQDLRAAETVPEIEAVALPSERV